MPFVISTGGKSGRPPSDHRLVLGALNDGGGGVESVQMIDSTINPGAPPGGRR